MPAPFDSDVKVGLDWRARHCDDAGNEYRIVIELQAKSVS